MITKEINGRKYQKVNGYWLPIYEPSSETRTLRKYGNLRWNYLKKSRKIEDIGLLTELELKGQLITYLVDLEEEAEEMAENLRKKMLDERGINRDLQRSNYQAYLQVIMQIERDVEELILNTLIYV